MILTTPFHERTAALNQTGLWEHWSNHLAARRYQLSDKAEYFAVRDSAGIFDTSPLFKYRVSGPDAEAFLAGMPARDVRIDGYYQCGSGTHPGSCVMGAPGMLAARRILADRRSGAAATSPGRSS